MKFMTEVHWHYDDEGIFTHCSFSHIEILSQEGDIIIAKDEDGIELYL